MSLAMVAAVSGHLADMRPAFFDYGIHRVIASSFGDIFSQNATKNGLLTAVVSEAESGALIAALTSLRFIGRCLDFG